MELWTIVCFVRPVRAVHPIGAVIAGILSVWASFNFLRGSLTGAPPMYSHGWVQRGLHFIAGIIFASLSVGALLMLTGKWHPRLWSKAVILIASFPFRR